MPENKLTISFGKDNTKTDDKPTDDILYAIARIRPGEYPQYIKAVGRKIVITQDPYEAMTFSSRMEAGIVCADLEDDTWCVVSYKRTVL